MNISVTGMMGTGKSTVARILASRLDMEYCDIDSLIIENAGRDIVSIFRDKGEPYFRLLEKTAIAEVSKKNNLVISTGGGTVLDPQNMENLEKNGIIVCLTASADKIYARLKEDDSRPLLKVTDPEKEIEKILGSRADSYTRCDLMIDTTDISADTAADSIIDYIKSIRQD